MSQADFDTALDVRIRTMRLIIFALINGIVLFMAIAIFQRANGQFGEPHDPLLISPISLVFGVVMVIAHLVIPNPMAASARRQIARGQGPSRTENLGAASIPGEAGQLLGVYQTRLILAAAFLEGATFFLLVAYLIEGQFYTLLAAILLLGLLALKFPTRSGVERWLEEQQELLRQERTNL